MINKITSNSGFIFLFNEIPHEQRNKLGIASGESVLLSIYENDSYYFTTNINLIAYDAIAKTEEPTPLEIDFFNLLKNEEKKELKYKRALVDEYDISKYVHYLPKVKYTQTAADNKILIHGEIKYPDNIYAREVPTVLLNDEIVPLIDEVYFEYMVDSNSPEDKLAFKLDLPKQVVTRPYKIKK